VEDGAVTKGVAEGTDPVLVGDAAEVAPPGDAEGIDPHPARRTPRRRDAARRFAFI
jgi:hypothetical protein